jgi:hypothetical protein
MNQNNKIRFIICSKLTHINIRYRIIKYIEIEGIFVIEETNRKLKTYCWECN